MKGRKRGKIKKVIYRHNEQKNVEKSKKIVYYQEKVKFYKIPLKKIENVFIMDKSTFKEIRF